MPSSALFYYFSGLTSMCNRLVMTDFPPLFTFLITPSQPTFLLSNVSALSCRPCCFTGIGLWTTCPPDSSALCTVWAFSTPFKILAPSAQNASLYSYLIQVNCLANLDAAGVSGSRDFRFCASLATTPERMLLH